MTPTLSRPPLGPVVFVAQLVCRIALIRPHFLGLHPNITQLALWTCTRRSVHWFPGYRHGRGKLISRQLPRPRLQAWPSRVLVSSQPYFLLPYSQYLQTYAIFQCRKRWGGIGGMEGGPFPHNLLLPELSQPQRTVLSGMSCHMTAVTTKREAVGN